MGRLAQPVITLAPLLVTTVSVDHDNILVYVRPELIGGRAIAASLRREAEWQPRDWTGEVPCTQSAIPLYPLDFRVMRRPCGAFFQL